MASRVGGIPEIIESGIDGILVAPEDSRALQRALTGIASSRSMKEELGHAARAKVLAKFSLDKTYELVRSLYDLILGNTYKRRS